MPVRSESFTIERSLPAERFDTFLRHRFPAASRGALQRLIEQGHVTVNGQKVKPTHSPRAGEVVHVEWPEARPATAQPENIPDLCFSINLSVNAFESENLAAFVRSQLSRHSVPAKSIVFEITESLAVRHLKHVEQQITSLRRIGCQLALDDFGTGYSSFSHLKRLSVDFIKIDGCFIRELVESQVDQKMVKMIAEIGREAGMKTIAEYVQSHAALKLLAELGVDFAQGYYIGRPSAAPTRRSMPVSIDSRRQPRAALPG
jgi:EAL domain-containing protein (putative c-di-GMP-specific phosphodiesterase class I)